MKTLKPVSGVWNKGCVSLVVKLENGAVFMTRAHSVLVSWLYHIRKGYTVVQVSLPEDAPPSILSKMSPMKIRLAEARRPDSGVIPISLLPESDSIALRPALLIISEGAHGSIDLTSEAMGAASGEIELDHKLFLHPINLN